MALRQSSSTDPTSIERPLPSLIRSGTRSRYDESWVEIASQPSSSSLSSAADDMDPSISNTRRVRRRMTLEPPHAEPRAESVHGTSSQEEYDESESESDKVLSSSGEGPQLTDNITSSRIPSAHPARPTMHTESDDDENRTAVNYPIHTGNAFTPQPNAFSHPPQTRSASQPVAGSYFPTMSKFANPSPSDSRQRTSTQTHLPRNILSPSYNAAAHHDEALRNSLSTLLSCAAAARGLKNDSKARATTPAQRSRNEPMTLRLVPESALPASSPTFDLQAPVSKPTLRRHSETTTSTSPDRVDKARRAGRASSKERRVAKKVRRSSSAEELGVSPTLLTWVLSAGVVVVLSALSFSAGYSLGKESGRMEVAGMAGLSASERDLVGDCAREASRGLGLKRSLARSAVQV